MQKLRITRVTATSISRDLDGRYKHNTRKNIIVQSQNRFLEQICSVPWNEY